MSEKNKQQSVEPTESAPPPEKVLLYSKSKWKGIIDVYTCGTCGFSDESEDTMKLHVLVHFPKEQQDTVLDKLVYMEGKG